MLCGKISMKIESKNALINMLAELFGSDSPVEKKKKLEEQGLKMTETFERRVQDMCNYSDLILEQGIERGIEQGIEQGESETIIRLVANKKLAPEDGAEELGISVEEVKRMVLSYLKGENIFNK